MSSMLNSAPQNPLNDLESPFGFVGRVEGKGAALPAVAADGPRCWIVASRGHRGSLNPDYTQNPKPYA